MSVILAKPARGGSTSGGAGFTELTATGSVNGNNTIFTFIQQPSYIVADGVWYKINKGWSWSVLTATMFVAPTYAIFGVA